MQKCAVLLVALTIAFFTSNFANSQIPGAVSFKFAKNVSSDVKEEVVQSQAEKRKALSGIDETELFLERTKKQRIWDNPRFVKYSYGYFKGMQQSVEKVQNDELEKKEYANEDEKKAALEKIKSQALVQFDDYEQENTDSLQKMNKSPRTALQEITTRLNYIEKEKMTPDYSKYIQKKTEERFVQTNGVSMDEYQEALRTQMEEQQKLRALEQQKSDSFPPLKTTQDVNVEKIDDQNALLQVSVGAPRSKKRK